MKERKVSMDFVANEGRINELAVYLERRKKKTKSRR